MHSFSNSSIFPCTFLIGCSSVGSLLVAVGLGVGVGKVVGGGNAVVVGVWLKVFLEEEGEEEEVAAALCRLGDLCFKIFCRLGFSVGKVAGFVGWVDVGVGWGFLCVGLRFRRAVGWVLFWVSFSLFNCLVLGVSTTSAQISTFVLLEC